MAAIQLSCLVCGRGPFPDAGGLNRHTRQHHVGTRCHWGLTMGHFSGIAAGIILVEEKRILGLVEGSSSNEESTFKVRSTLNEGSTTKLSIFFSYVCITTFANLISAFKGEKVKLTNEH